MKNVEKFKLIFFSSPNHIHLQLEISNSKKKMFCWMCYWMYKWLNEIFHSKLLGKLMKIQLTTMTENEMLLVECKKLVKNRRITWTCLRQPLNEYFIVEAIIARKILEIHLSIHEDDFIENELRINVRGRFLRYFIYSLSLKLCGWFFCWENNYHGWI